MGPMPVPNEKAAPPGSGLVEIEKVVARGSGPHPEGLVLKSMYWRADMKGNSFRTWEFW